ncbi:MAG TPA: ubiquinone biosynthesis regulatory protein kinase UbiB, partial [Chromatiaceae bacterium]|nr:ubiquinone biosynthesis regulatory protein kinase UbiB [Chromatiaceae bacterium]
QLVLLQKTLLNIEGLGRQLYPELDLWTTAKPFMEKWMKEQIGPRALLARLRRNLGPYSEEMPELPLLAYRVLQGLDRQTLPIRWRSEEMERLHLEIRNHHARIRDLIVGGSFVLSGTLILLIGPGPFLPPSAYQAIALAIITFGSGLLAMRWY